MKDTPASKACTKCGEVKYLDDFHKSNKGYLNRVAECKSCARERYLLNRSKKISQVSEYKKRHPDRVARAKSRWYENNKESVKAYHRRLYLSNREERVNKAKIRYWEDPEKYRSWYRSHAKRNRSYINKRCRERYREDASFRVRESVRGFLNRTLRASGDRKTSSTYDILGYTVEGLTLRIGFQMKPGMSWDNYGEWHIDHKIPISRFVNKGETRPHIINALSNLQPMWAEENMRKGARWIG